MCTLPYTTQNIFQNAAFRPSYCCVCILMLPPPSRSTLFPYTTLFRSLDARSAHPGRRGQPGPLRRRPRSEEHTSELQSRGHLVCRLLLEKKKDDYDLPAQGAVFRITDVAERLFYGVIDRDTTRCVLYI